MSINDELMERVTELAVAHQPEPLDLVAPLLTCLEVWSRRWPEAEGELLAAMCGLWLSGLHGVILSTGRVDIADLRAWLAEALDDVERLLIACTPVTQVDGHLLLVADVPGGC